ncbi:hypothetical protein Scep_018147 [Stephania cephalantha]|uniref:Methyltransferase small domain-containing protein n=1 Tax=Stephania cephalantha TaxID=152367 RepID=A0AAP0NVJ4_9MAGN
MALSLFSFAAQPSQLIKSRETKTQSSLTPLSVSANPNSSPACALQCQHFDSCSGCTHQWNLHRPVVLDEVTEFFRDLGVSDFTFDTCRLWGWRCRAKLAVRGSSDKPLVGLYEEGTHNVRIIPTLMLLLNSSNKAGLAKLDVQPYDEDSGTGELRYVQMAVTLHNTSLLGRKDTAVGADHFGLEFEKREFTQFRQVKCLSPILMEKWWPKQLCPSSSLCMGQFSDLEWRHLLGERDFWEHVGGIDVALAPSSFGQANTRAFDSLLRKLHTYVPYGTSVTDLYAGAGVIGLSLAVARKCRSVKCVEINKEAKASFEKTISRLPESVDSSISWHQADTSNEPLSWLEGSDVVVVDPPRKGLDPPLLDALQTIASSERKAQLSESSSLKEKNEKRPWILRAREAAVQIESKTTWEKSSSLPQTLIYISCGWESFKEVCDCNR